MAGNTLDIEDIIEKDEVGYSISNQYLTWYNLKTQVTTAWDEVRRYVYATDTRHTSNNALPWKNTTTIPKLCQIRDNLIANYMASLFPKRKWMQWEADSEDSDQKDKRDTIENYMSYVVDRSNFREIIQKAVQDYIDTGNAFATVQWCDDRIFMDGESNSDKVGYVGPKPVRISPLDIVFNPISTSFEDSPKIVRSITTLGALKKQLVDETKTVEDREAIEDLFKYLRKIRHSAQHADNLYEKDAIFQIDGYSSFRDYLIGPYCEVLTFYGDLYDVHNDKFYENHVITVVDRHKVISIKPNPSFFGKPSIFHAGWRKRQDNLWAMGPLENLVGMQYRIDHLENLKADLMDITVFPPLKIKGQVDQFTWGPFERIYTDSDGDIEVMQISTGAYQVELQIDSYIAKMEEMAGAPKEAMGFRTPGEKTAYEVQRLENAAARIFQAKITQFEIEIVEPLLNAMLELAKRLMDGETTIRVFNDEFKVDTFQSLSPSDITGIGRIRPMAARNFAEKAEMVQNLNSLFSSPLGANPSFMNHWSMIKMSEMFEELLDLEPYDLVSANIGITEAADAQRLTNSAEEQVLMETGTPAGLSPDDSDMSMM